MGEAVMKKPLPLPELTDEFLGRFWGKVNKGPACWEWMGGKNPPGYGVISFKNRQLKAHRVAYQLICGPVAEGMVLDHLCRNKGCVNPSHLEPVESATNVMRGISAPAINARKTTCAEGHQYTTYLTRRGERIAPRRRCPTCDLNNLRKRNGSWDPVLGFVDRRRKR